MSLREYRQKGADREAHLGWKNGMEILEFSNQQHVFFHIPFLFSEVPKPSEFRVSVFLVVKLKI